MGNMKGNWARIPCRPGLSQPQALSALQVAWQQADGPSPGGRGMPATPSPVPGITLDTLHLGSVDLVPKSPLQGHVHAHPVDRQDDKWGSFPLTWSRTHRLSRAGASTAPSRMQRMQEPLTLSPLCLGLGDSLVFVPGLIPDEYLKKNSDLTRTCAQMS